MTNEPQIKDIPSLKKTLQEIKTVKTLKSFIPILRPFLKIFGLEKLDELFEKYKIDEMELKAEELASLPDRFNDLFAERGWILFDQMDFKIAKSVVSKAESGDIDGAETDLINYFNDQTVKSKLETMIAVQAFRARMPLAQKALIDYREGRYHACIPVVLALLDGMITEVNQQRLGFFAEDVNLEAWDSIAGHSKGLMALSNIFKKGRRKTSTEQITIPYRHGIMHGMDLGYDNQLVAAKTWAALFAAREWAIKAERGSLTSPPPETKKSWGELFQQLREISEDKAKFEKQLEEWKPRAIKPGIDIPKTGTPEVFSNGSPELKMAEYLNLWKNRNYGDMAKCLNFILFDNPNEMPPLIRNKYASKKLKLFEFTEIKDDAPAVSEIQTRLIYEENNIEHEKSIRFRLLNLNKKELCVRGEPNSVWVVQNWNEI
jgi:hypothetical protein